jgi:hypothetical protein
MGRGHSAGKRQVMLKYNLIRLKFVEGNLALSSLISLTKVIPFKKEQIKRLSLHLIHFSAHLHLSLKFQH